MLLQGADILCKNLSKGQRKEAAAPDTGHWALLRLSNPLGKFWCADLREGHLRSRAKAKGGETVQTGCGPWLQDAAAKGSMALEKEPLIHHVTGSWAALANSLNLSQ